VIQQRHPMSISPACMPQFVLIRMKKMQNTKLSKCYKRAKKSSRYWEQIAFVRSMEKAALKASNISVRTAFVEMMGIKKVS